MKNKINLHDIDLNEIYANGGTLEYGPDGARYNDSAMIIAPKTNVISTFGAQNGINDICKDFTLSRDLQGKRHFEKKQKPKKFKIKNSK